MNDCVQLPKSFCFDLFSYAASEMSVMLQVYFLKIKMESFPSMVES